MKKVLLGLLVFVLFFGAIAGGVYAYKETTGISNEELIAEIQYNAADLLITLGGSDTAPPLPEKPAPKKIKTDPKPAEPAAIAVQPPTNQQINAKDPAQPPVAAIIQVSPEKQKAKELIKEANRYFDEALEVMKKSYDYKDKQFFIENEKALNGFRKASKLYEEASELDPDNDWLNNRVRESGKNRYTCFKQGAK